MHNVLELKPNFRQTDSRPICCSSDQDGGAKMSWITLSTALLYSSLLAYLVLVKEWSLLNAGLVMIGLGLAVMTTIVAVIMSMPGEDRQTVWQAFQGTGRRELREVMGLLLFRRKK